MKPKISAIICTYNREKYLPKAIQSLVDQTLDSSQYEIIVVDNRSTDQTKQIVTEQFSHISNLKYIYEPIQGLSQARNTGWQNARGKYVAYIDDDAIADNNWLKNILKAFKKDNKIGAVGGKVEPIWEKPRPKWLKDKNLGFLTIVDWSVEPIFLSQEEWFAGTNMALKKRVLKQIKGFNTKLGRNKSSLLSNEEIECKNKIEKLGHKNYYDPSIKVSHHIPKERLNKLWFLKRAYYQGKSNAISKRKTIVISRFDILKLFILDFSVILRLINKLGYILTKKEGK